MSQQWLQEEGFLEIIRKRRSEVLNNIDLKEQGVPSMRDLWVRFK